MRLKKSLWVFVGLVIYALLYTPGIFFSETVLNDSPFLKPQWFFLAYALFYYKFIANAGDDGLTFKNAKKNVFLGTTLAWCVLIPILLFAAFIETSPLAFSDRMQNLVFFYPSVTWLSLLVLAPIAEEIFFRGMVFSQFNRIQPPWLAVIMSSLIFMASHGSIIHIGAFILGVVAACLRLKTRSILPGMIYHAWSNTFGPSLIVLCPSATKILDYFLL